MDGSVGGKRTAGEMSEDHDRCFSMLVLVVVSARTKKVIIIWYLGHFRQCFSMLYTELTLATRGIEHHDRESSIMTGVYSRWCSSTLHIGWGLCASSHL
jgi:hypothetical protein